MKKLLAFSVSVLACVLYVGSAWGTGTRTADPAESPAVNTEQDVVAVEVSVAADPTPSGSKGVNITIALCVKTAPSSSSSYKVKVGGATVNLTPATGGTFIAQLYPGGGGGPQTLAAPWRDTGFDEMGPFNVSNHDGSTTTIPKEWCFKFTVRSAFSSSGTPADAPNAGLPVPKGAVPVTVTSHANSTASGAAVDTASGPVVRYKN
jgi:hypothetical protein